MFNLSVLVTDAFMAAVQGRRRWDLVFGGKVYRTRAGARAVGPHHARDLRLRRAGRDLHRPHQRREQPRLLRDDQRDQPVRRAAAAAVWRLPAGLDQSRAPGRASRSRRSARLDDERAGAAGAARPCACSTTSIDVSRFPLPQQEQEAKAKRRIGLGVTGLADALIFCGVRYGTPEAVQLAEQWMARHRSAPPISPRPSSRAEKGAFPLYDRDALSRRRDDARRCPRTCARRSRRTASATRCLTSIAPTGTISLLADNVSSGIEPVFAFRYVRHVLQPDGTQARGERRGLCLARCAARSRATTPPPADIFVDAAELTPADHLAMQAAVQAYVDSSISKTINCPARHLLRGLQGCLRRGLCDWAARAARPTGRTT